MDYLFSEYGPTILEMIAAAIMFTFIISMFIIVLNSGAVSTPDTPELYKIINGFIQGLVGSA